MAILKREYSTWKVETGDSEMDSEMVDQLVITDKEITSAINQEAVADQLFSRVLKNRSKAHKALLDKIPGATEH